MPRINVFGSPEAVLKDSKGRPVDLDWLDYWMASNQSERTYDEGRWTVPHHMEMGSFIERTGRILF